MNTASSKKGGKKGIRVVRRNVTIVRRPAPAAKAGAGATTYDSGYVKKMIALWADPCRAMMVHPPYAGTTTGYLIRTVDILRYNVRINAAATPLINSAVPVDQVFQWSPSNYSPTTGYVMVGGATDLGGNYADQAAAYGGNSFVVSSPSVRTFRAVASCLEWVPTGPIGTRAGSVSLTSCAGMVLNAGVSYIGNELLAQYQVSKPNAADTYEVNWLPTSLDEELETSGELSHKGVGTCSIMLSGVDGTVTSTSAGLYYARPNGFFRATTVWEWTPAISGGIIPEQRKPPGLNTQQILSQVNVEKVAHGIGRGVANAGIGFLASALSSRRAGRTFPRIEL